MKYTAHEHLPTVNSEARQGPSFFGKIDGGHAVAHHTYQQINQTL